jgi:hypothetical protein
MDERVEVETAGGEGPVTITTPEGLTEQATPGQGRVSFRSSSPGFYSLESKGWREDIAVSFLAPEESDLLAGVGQERSAASVEALEAPGSGRSYWQILLAAAIALLTLDWTLYHHGKLS